MRCSRPPTQADTNMLVCEKPHRPNMKPHASNVSPIVSQWNIVCVKCARISMASAMYISCCFCNFFHVGYVNISGGIQAKVYHLTRPEGIITPWHDLQHLSRCYLKTALSHDLHLSMGCDQKPD